METVKYNIQLRVTFKYLPSGEEHRSTVILMRIQGQAYKNCIDPRD